MYTVTVIGLLRMTSPNLTESEKFTDGLSVNQVVATIRSNGSEFKFLIMGSVRN